MSDRSDRRHIKELRQKLTFLAGDERARQIHGRGTQKQLAAASNVNESTFKTLKSASGKGRISADQERSLAKACYFRVDWPEWMTGTAAEFQTRYLREVKARAKATSEKRRTDIPLTAHDGEQNTKDGRLASMKMRALSNSGIEWRVWIDLFCRAVDGYGIHRGFVTLDCGEALADREEANFKQLFPVISANAALRLAAGTNRKQIWEMRALANVLDDDICPSEHYGIVKQIADGNTVNVSFSVYIKDVPAEDPYVCWLDGKPLIGVNRRLILDRIATLDLLDGKGDVGAVVLCSHEVTFKDTDGVLRQSELADK